MSATSFTLSSAKALQTSVLEKLFNIFASPVEVFDEVVSSPANLANWRIPTLLVSFASIISVQLGNFPSETAVAIHKLTESGTIAAGQAQALAGAWPLLSALSIFLATFLGSCWSAFVLWFIGRTFLRVSFPYAKALEIVGLASVVSLLGTIITILLIAASGDHSAEPALSLLALKLDHSRPLFQTFATFNLFYLWSTTVLAIGLSRLCNATFKEVAFWVFGYWTVAKVVLILLQ